MRAGLEGRTGSSRPSAGRGGVPGVAGGRVGFVEEAQASEVTEHPALEGTACPLQAVALQVLPVVGLKQGGLMEADLTVGALREADHGGLRSLTRPMTTIASFARTS